MTNDYIIRTLKDLLEITQDNDLYGACNDVENLLIHFKSEDEKPLVVDTKANLFIFEHTFKGDTSLLALKPSEIVDLSLDDNGMRFALKVRTGPNGLVYIYFETKEEGQQAFELFLEQMILHSK